MYTLIYVLEESISLSIKYVKINDHENAVKKTAFGASFFISTYIKNCQPESDKKAFWLFLFFLFTCYMGGKFVI